MAVDELFISSQETRAEVAEQLTFTIVDYVCYRLRCWYCDREYWAVVRSGDCSCCGGSLQEAWIRLGSWKGFTVWVRPELLSPESHP